MTQYEGDRLGFLMKNGMSLDEIQHLRESGMSMDEIIQMTDVFASFDFFTVPSLTDAERKPPEFIVSDMLPVGLTFLSGAPKTRKSFFAVQLAIAVATGTEFFGRKTIQTDVVYLDLEGSKSRIASRTQRMSIPIPSNIFITNQIEEKLADSLVDKLKQLHHQRPTIRLVIIDTYSRARGYFKTGGANAYDVDVALLEPLQRMAIEESISVLCVHHDRKGAALMSDSFERLSGTMGISGSADCVMNLTTIGKRFDGHATLEFTPRDGRGGEINLVFSEASLEWFEEQKPDVRGNPICAWLIKNAPEKGREGQFYSYEDIFLSAYHIKVDNSGECVLEQLRPRREELLQTFNLGIQLGVRSNGKRGLRIINLQ